MDTKSIDRKTTNRKPVEVESASRPGLVHYVSADLMHCSCEATVEVFRHVRIARVRIAKKRLASLRDRFNHELLSADERCELRDEILRLKRRVA